MKVACRVLVRYLEYYLGWVFKLSFKSLNSLTGGNHPRCNLVHHLVAVKIFKKLIMMYLIKPIQLKPNSLTRTLFVLCLLPFILSSAVAQVSHENRNCKLLGPKAFGLDPEFNQAQINAANRAFKGVRTIEDALMGRNWACCPHKNFPELEAGFIKLSKLPLARLKKAVQVYLDTKTFGSSKGLSPFAANIVYTLEWINRNLDVGVLDRIVFYGKMRLAPYPSSAFYDYTPLWTKHQGVWHLLEYKSPIGDDFNGQGEFLAHMKAVEKETRK